MTQVARIGLHGDATSERQLDWLAGRVPDAPVNPKGKRRAMDKRNALRGIFWLLDSGAHLNDLPSDFGSMSAEEYVRASTNEQSVVCRFVECGIRIVQ